MLDFDKIVRQEQEGLRRFLLSLCLGNQVIADDLAQEAFIKAYLSQHTFVGRSKVSTWLYRISYNTFIDYTRKKTLEKVDIEKANKVEYDEPQHYESLYRALNMIKEPRRAIIVLFYLEDQSIKEIAKITRIKDGTIKYHLCEGRKELKVLLEHEDK